MPDNNPTHLKFATTTGNPATQGAGRSAAAQAMRYASFNVADNIATAIRQDTTLNPMLFVIGLNETDASGNIVGEPLDEDWLARVANDPV